MITWQWMVQYFLNKKQKRQNKFFKKRQYLCYSFGTRYKYCEQLLWYLIFGTSCCLFRHLRRRQKRQRQQSVTPAASFGTFFSASYGPKEVVEGAKEAAPTVYSSFSCWVRCVFLVIYFLQNFKIKVPSKLSYLEKDLTVYKKFN